MICRLCLINIKVENRISLFNEVESGSESQMLKLIAKYFFLEITQHDALSTTICQECYNHLDEFHTFCLYVEQQQSTLRNEFLEVKCDVQLSSDGMDIAVENENDESLLDIKDVLAEPINANIKCEPHDSFKAENEDSNAGIDERDGLDSVSGSDDDDVPLKNLQTKINIISKPVIKKKKQNPKKEARVKKSSKEISNATTSTVTAAANIEAGELKETTNLTSARQSSVKKKKKDKVPKTNTKDAEEKDQFIAKHLQLKCELCDQPAEKFSDLRTHFKESHDRCPYVICCGSRIVQRKDLYDHIQWHLNPEYFKCGECGKLLKNRSSLGAHVVSKHHKIEDRIYKCNLCEKSFALKYWLKQHITYHQAEKTFICEYCNKSFITQLRLDKHIKSMHDNIFPHICDICGKKFKSKPSFDAHVLEHQGIVQPPMQCQICGEWKKNKNGLRHHMASHNKVDVKCKYCGRECFSQMALRRHVQYMHRRTPSWQCKYCDRLFKDKCALEEHVATHTGVNLYNCPHCIKECRSRANMYVHIKRQHPQEWLAAQLARPTNAPPDAKNAAVV